MAAITQSNDGKKALPEEQLSGPTEPRRDDRQPPIKIDNLTALPKKSAPSFFAIYKKGHGYWTRMGTAIGAGLLGLIMSFEIYSQLPTFMHGTQSHDKRVAFIAAAVFLVAYTLWAYWFTNKPSTVEFLVATDSEMKKVNWTTRQELIGSTKVVIGFMFIVAIFLFVCDLVFGSFFHLVGVLKTWI